MQKLYKAVVGERNYVYYLHKFEQFDQQGGKYIASWNWPAFVATGAWALYRKMTNWFWIMWGISLAARGIDKAGYGATAITMSIAAHIAFGVYANTLYHHETREKINAAQSALKDEQKLQDYLINEGGVRTWAIWVFGTLYLVIFFLPLFV